MPPAGCPSAPAGADVASPMRHKDVQRMTTAVCWIAVPAAKLVPVFSTVNGGALHESMGRYPLVA